VNAREQIAEALNREGAFCGQCGREPGDPISDCPDCARCLYGYADAIMPLVDRLRAEAKSEALEEFSIELAKLRISFPNSTGSYRKASARAWKRAAAIRSEATT
jgi:hypothetical protein